jgi:NADH dehydrogenase/NADH:ubiquinone oxidoreductase subunit G
MAEMQPEQGSVPSPDPTVLTSAALYREIAGLRELVLDRIEAETGISKEKFCRIDKQMATAEQQRKEQKQDTKEAVDQALAAQQEAVAKSEKATEKQLEEIKTNSGATIEGLRRELGDLKERVVSVEQQKVGAVEQKAGMGANAGLAIAASGVILAFIVVITNVLTSQ